jgi:aspartyl-tRNA(Asn)/glutamyl-tRNA(Gln) amidotransferase subunit A
VKRRVLLGAFSLSADAIENYFIQAQKVRRLVQRDFDNVFSLSNLLSQNQDIQSVEKASNQVDVLICPTAPSPPPTLESLKGASPVDAYMNDVFTVPASLAGLPALSVPVSADGSKDAGPVGIQVIGQYGDDDLVLDVGTIIESAV